MSYEGLILVFDACVIPMYVHIALFDLVPYFLHLFPWGAHVKYFYHEGRLFRGHVFKVSVYINKQELLSFPLFLF